MALNVTIQSTSELGLNASLPLPRSLTRQLSPITWQGWRGVSHFCHLGIFCYPRWRRRRRSQRPFSRWRRRPRRRRQPDISQRNQWQDKQVNDAIKGFTFSYNKDSDNTFATSLPPSPKRKHHKHRRQQQQNQQRGRRRRRQLRKPTTVLLLASRHSMSRKPLCRRCH